MSTTSSSQKWADAPFPLISETHASSLLPSSMPADHACIFWARQMALIHNTMIRGLNAAINQCLSIRPGTKEAADFLLFNQTLFEMLDHHHKVEEDYMFPEIEKLLDQPGAMEGNVAQHHAFEEGLGLYEKYVTKTTSEDFHGATFKHIVESFGDILVQHFHDEIPTLLDLHTLDSSEMMRIWKVAEHMATHDADPYTNLPLVLSCPDRTFMLDGVARPFPPAPFFVPWLVSAWFGRRNSGSWQFSPCDFGKNPRALSFAS